MGERLSKEERAELQRLIDDREFVRDPISGSIYLTGRPARMASDCLPRLLDGLADAEAERDEWKRRAKERRDHAMKCAQDAKYLRRERDHLREQLTAASRALEVANRLLQSGCYPRDTDMAALVVKRALDQLCDEMETAFCDLCNDNVRRWQDPVTGLFVHEPEDPRSGTIVCSNQLGS